MSGKEGIDHRKYGFTKYTTTTSPDGCIPDGAEFTVTLYNTDHKETCKFTAYYHSPSTYEQVFKEARFKTLQWVPYKLDPNVPIKEFFDDFFKYTPAVGLISTKK
ncbi:unnamed protein product [Adineta ricciae]|uniref:Uncharacterized protein n=1 Tax=Adineta ricciae TaxID=249248 RepID=A0A815X5N9_ADIRI|nr:unnamed protein product [Adineta ricciae]CAF1667539.1 unnamed protein product [Adineta ricciae]